MQYNQHHRGIRTPASGSGYWQPTTPYAPMASWPLETPALWTVTTPDAAVWGPPLMYHDGETVTLPTFQKWFPLPLPVDLIP